MSAVQAASAAFEERVARGLREAGFAAAERIRVKHPDRGDIGGVPYFTVECKGIAPGHGGKCPACGQSTGRFDMAAALDQAEKARAFNGTPYAMVVRQRKQAALDRLPCIVEFAQLAALMHEAEGNANA